jgi:hypothetical protein
MPMHSKRFRGNQLRLSALLVVLSPTWMAGGSSQAGFPLTSLTVPESNLPIGCRLRPEVPPPPPVARAGQTETVVAENRGSFASNPWIGADRRLLIELRKRIDGELRLRLPDAPPPSAAEVAALEHRWVADIVEGYQAVYISPVLGEDAGFKPPVTVAVSAIRFNNAMLATTAQSVGSTNASRGVSDRFVIDAVVMQVQARLKTDCFSSVAAYLRSLK